MPTSPSASLALKVAVKRKEGTYYCSTKKKPSLSKGDDVHVKADD